MDDSKLKCRRLSTSSEIANQVRRSSISIIPPKYSDNTSNKSNNNLLSSFEENTGSCTVLTNINTQSSSSKPTSKNSSNTNINSELNTDNKNINKTNNQQIIENTCAPIISVSSVIDDVIIETKENYEKTITTTISEVKIIDSDKKIEQQEKLTGDQNNETSIAIKEETKTTVSIPDIIKTVSDVEKNDEEIIQDIDKSIPLPRLELAMAPLAVPDSESPCSEYNPDVSETQQVVAVIEKDENDQDNIKKDVIHIDIDKSELSENDKSKDATGDTKKDDNEIMDEIMEVKDLDKNNDQEQQQQQQTSHETTTTTTTSVSSQHQDKTTSSDEKELKTQKSQENSTSVDSKQKEICPWEDE